MDFSLTEEQLMLKDSVTKFMSGNYSPEQRNAIIKQANGAGHWSSFAELGWLTVPFAEEQGGFGGSIVDTCVLMEEFGKVLVVEPYWPSIVLAGQLLARSSNKALSQSLLPGIMAGDVQASFAWLEVQGEFRLSHVNSRAQRDGDHYILNGEKLLVLNAAADIILLPVRSSGEVGSEQGISLFKIDARNPAVQREEVALMDGQRAVNIRFSDLRVPASDMLTAEGDAYPLMLDVVEEGLIALCAEAVGAMEYLYKATAEYANTRKQFGTAIGKFQALQHRMVDMFMATEQCRSLLIRAQCSVLDGSAERGKDIAALKSMVGKYGRKVAEEAVQLHGGMGVSNEMPIGHYLKRLMMIDSYFGNAANQRRKYCELSYA
ncbi:acyl-CoA dehydrogenase family protein [Zhongshania sp.]|uniref:acyl-CoA dehydrogenase family protein n=1 Tax=Zhongshania sp. TaxID=1971902 RepID=UPI003562A14E